MQMSKHLPSETEGPDKAPPLTLLITNIGQKLAQLNRKAEDGLGNGAKMAPTPVASQPQNRGRWLGPRLRLSACPPHFPSCPDFGATGLSKPQCPLVESFKVAKMFSYFKEN